MVIQNFCRNVSPPTPTRRARCVRKSVIFSASRSIENVRIINRYDIEGVPADVLEKCIATVFSEPQVDDMLESLPQTDGAVFAAEYLPGQFDQRADSAAQCVQFISGGARPLVRSAKVYLLEGGLSDAQVEADQEACDQPRRQRARLPLRSPTRWPPRRPRLRMWRRSRASSTMDDDALVSLVDSLRAGDGRRRPPLLPRLFPSGAPRPDDDRAADDRHLLVGSLPPYHLFHRYRRSDRGERCGRAGLRPII